MSRQLDVAIAEALGDKVEYSLLEYPEGEDCDYWVDELNVRLPHYSTDGNAMLELDKEMRERGWSIQITYILPENKYEASYEGDYREVVAVADTMQLAVSLAAYEALTEEEWEE